MAGKKVRMRVRVGGMGLDEVWVDDHKVLITKRWTEVSSTLAKKLVGSEYNGRPKFEFEDDLADEAESEDSSSGDI